MNAFGQRHLFEQFFRAHGVARIQHHAPGNRAHHGDVFQCHLRRAVLADAHPDVRADELEIGLRNARDANLVKRAGEKTRERGRKRHLAAGAKTGGHADHVLLGNETFRETVREFFEKLFGERGVFCVAIHRDNARVRSADAFKRGTVGFARCDQVTWFISDGRVAGRRGVVGRGQWCRRGNRNADAGFRAGLKFGDGFGGFLLVQRFAVPAVLVL